MPTLAYSLFVLVVYFTPETKDHRAWVNFLIAMSVPVAGYLFPLIILPLRRLISEEFIVFNIYAMLLLPIIAALVFFFLVRSVFILATKKAAIWQKYQLAWKIPIAIVLPLIGLLVNSGHLFSGFRGFIEGVFGDFNNSWFYVLAIVNGILVCLPNLDNKIYRLLLFIGRSITFAYTFYFFLVFLPFLPLSVVAIIAIGAGFLMLAPLLLFVVHISELSEDFQYLKTFFSTKQTFGIFLMGFLVIPALITATYLKDKSVLNETLAYLYSPDYSKQYNIKKTSLQKTLNVVKGHNTGGFFGSRQPYLSAYFNWLVLDNLTLSDTKINYIEKIFFGNASSIKIIPENIRNDNVKITNIKSNSTYDKSQNAWKSWVDLEISNKNENAWTSEYSTTIDLPEGCWISDYYLYVGDRKEFGILAEKKSAMWVFSNIRNERKDPGILHYITGNKVAFRVFPFTKDEVRKTGIEFLHKEPIELTIDNNIVELGNTEETTNEKTETENIIYVSTQQKQTLKTVQRKPYFHFLVDVSKDKNKYLADFKNRIATILESNQLPTKNVQISFVNSYVNTFPLGDNWEQNLQAQTFEGGFYLERAINTTLFNAYKNKNEFYPVIVVVTDSIKNAIMDKDFSDFKFAFPESNYFFNLDNNGNLIPHSLGENPKAEREVKFECMFCETVLEYQLADNSIVYLPDDNEPSIILKKDVFETTEAEIKEKNWQSALTLQAKWTSQILHPETSEKEWLNLVKYSFVSKVMTPLTSYLVVENEAQKAILKKKQEQVLSGNKSLDLDEDTRRMSEPTWWILAILFGLIIWYKQGRKQAWRYR
ncbi:MAG: MSEP-CTERM sorting domain-containing protein [Sphingobacteriales bacterium]|nr:MSEP-CTERM sorting domain-containing protein [Sphingobacteriales bacterium]